MSNLLIKQQKHQYQNQYSVSLPLTLGFGTSNLLAANLMSARFALPCSTW